MTNLIDRIADLMLTDDEDRDKQSENIKRTWEASTVKERDRIDDIMISLCGYSLTTLLEDEE